MTVPEKIIIAELSQYISLNVISKSGLVGGGEDLNLPRKLYTVRKSIERIYDTDPTNSTLFGTSNMMLALCGKYQFIALAKQNSGGSVVPISPDGASPNDLDFIVSASSYIATGQSSVTFDGTGGMPDLRGYNVDFARNGTVQYTTPQAGSAQYYAWNNVTGLFQLLPAGALGQASEGESFRIMPDTGGGTASIAPTLTFPFVVTSADFEADGITLLDSRITGNSIYLLSNNVPNPVLTAPSDFSYVAGGIEIILPGFDANSFSYTIVVNKIN